MSKVRSIVFIAAFIFLGLMVSPQEWAFATIPPQGVCDVTLTSSQNIQAVVDIGGPKTICLQGTFKQSVIIGPEDTAAGYITIQGVSPGGIMDGQNGIGPPDPGTSYSGGMDAFELLPGVNNVTIRELVIKDYKDPAAGTGTGNAIQAWGPYVPGAATSNVNIWNNNMHGFSWNGILVGNSGTGLHSNWSVEGNTIVPCWIGIDLTNTSNSAIEDNTVSGGGCFPTSYPSLGWVMGIMLQARNIAAEGGSGSLIMSNVSVKDNTITALGPATLEYGIYLLAWANGGPTATLSNIQVGGSGNRLENNAIHGIVLNGSEQGTVDGVSIVDNNILNNKTGIRVAGTSTNVTAHFNNISGNITWGANNTAAAELEAELNWWGSSSGPTHSGNPGGTGDAITDNVDYHPWLVTWPLSFYWKEYNGEGLGGYMPDIDQNQDFDKVYARTEENGNGVSCQGGWLPYTDSHASGGRITYTDNAQASCTYTFTGTSIRYIGTPSNNKGIARVWIDGNDMGDVDLYSATLKWQQVLYTNSNLSPGQHTITIVVTGRKNPSSSLHRIDVDAFDVDDIEHEYCAPVAEANSLWWLDKKYNLGLFDPQTHTVYVTDVNHDGSRNILDLVEELAQLMGTNVSQPGTTVEGEQAGIEEFLTNHNLTNELYEHTVYDRDFPDPPSPPAPPYLGWLNFFHYLEGEVERSQDVKLDLGFYRILDCDVQGEQILWQRVGGHAVTVAGVDSQNFLFAISDPDKDAAEAGQPGVVRTPVGQQHPPYPHDSDVHNNEEYASHDIYTVWHSPSPGGKMGLRNYPPKENLPPEVPVWAPWPSDFTECIPQVILTEIEAAVIVSPIICGNGVVDPGETCDPLGGQWPPNGNPCRETCTYCGDGIPNNGEQCDDGNANNNDGCTNICMLPVCGDSFIGPGETCDPPGQPGPNQQQPGTCRETCKYCGDGIVNNGEQCDDGNGVNGDGCENDCTPDITCSFLPDGTQIMRGGTLRFWATVQNNDDTTQNFKFATKAKLPNGNMYPDFLVGPKDVTLNSGQSASKQLSHTIPGTAPFGTYTYYGYVGNAPPAVEYGRCQFTFTVVQ